VVVCLERGADLHMAQLMPLPLTALAPVKSRLVLQASELQLIHMHDVQHKSPTLKMLSQ